MQIMHNYARGSKSPVKGWWFVSFWFSREA